MRRIVGNVGAFKLPNGEYGFGRIFKYADVAFYRHIGKNEKDLPKTEDYAFIVGVYNSSVSLMKYVEKRPYVSIPFTMQTVILFHLLMKNVRIWRSAQFGN